MAMPVDGRISIQISQGLKDGLGITQLGKGMHLIGDAGDATGLRLEYTEGCVGRPFSHPNLRQGWRRAPLVSETHDLLAHILQQLLGDIASVPHTSHHDPFLGFRSQSHLAYALIEKEFGPMLAFLASACQGDVGSGVRVTMWCRLSVGSLSLWE